MRTPSNKRARGRTGRRSPNPNRSYESNGPEGRIRGNANQVHDKYSQLARDASAAGDLVAAEGHWQHAEHYYRIMMAMQQQQRPPQGQNMQDGHDGGGEPMEHQQRPSHGSGERGIDPAEQDQPEVGESRYQNAAETTESETAGLARTMRGGGGGGGRRSRDQGTPPADDAAGEAKPTQATAKDAAAD